MPSYHFTYSPLTLFLIRTARENARRSGKDWIKIYEKSDYDKESILTIALWVDQNWHRLDAYERARFPKIAESKRPPPPTPKLKKFVWLKSWLSGLSG